MQYSRKSLANGKGEWGWSYRASYPYSFMRCWGEVRKVFGRDGRSFFEHYIYLYIYVYIQWHCWSELLPAVWQINWKELSGAWNQAECEGLGREHWRGAGQGLSKVFKWGHERGHCPERKDVGQGEEQEKVQGEQNISSRRSGTKNKVSSTADIRNMSWSFT